MAKYIPSLTMDAFLKSDADLRIVAGPVGSGKSSGSIIELPRRAKMQEPGPSKKRLTRFAVVRNTYRELADTTRKTFEQWIPSGRGGLGDWDEKNFTFELKVGEVESEILFRALDKPKDVKKLLSLDLTGAYLNEVRELPKQIVNGIQMRVGRYPPMKDGGPTFAGVWGDTNPWHTGHWGHKLFSKPDASFLKIPLLKLPRPGVRLKHQRGAVFELYRQPGGLDADAENLENLPDGYYDRLTADKDEDWIEVYVHGRDALNDKGSVFGKWLEKLDNAGAMAAFDHPQDQVFTTWDLGRRDATSIWFWRLTNGGVDVIDHYENSGEGLSHYFQVLDERGYSYQKHWLPHDAAQTTLAAESSVLDQFRGKYGAGKVAIGPSLSIEEGLGAARWLLERKIRFHPRCDDKGDRAYSGLEALREYKFEWDEKNQVFKPEPLHNWASHTADAFRYLACVAKVTQKLAGDAKPTPPPAPPKQLYVPGKTTELSLDELFELRDDSGPSGPSRV